MELDVLLLAAGFGRRLEPLTRQIPKALLPIYGTPLLDIQIARLLDSAPHGLAVRRIVVNGHHLAEHVRRHVAEHPRHEDLTFSFEEEILGTGGAIARAQGTLRSDVVAVINADTLFPLDLPEVVASHRQTGCLATMVLARSRLWPNVRAEGNRVTEIAIGRRLPSALTFAGCHILSQALIARLPRGGFHDIRDTYARLIAEGSLGAYVAAAGTPLLDVGTPARYLEAHRLCRGETARNWGLDPARIEERAAGFGFIDRNARVAAGARVRDSVVLAGAHLGPRAVLEHAILGPGVAVDGACRDLMVTTDGSVDISEEEGTAA